jgi:hypothetical protein
MEVLSSEDYMISGTDNERVTHRYRQNRHDDIGRWTFVCSEMRCSGTGIEGMLQSGRREQRARSIPCDLNDWLGISSPIEVSAIIIRNPVNCNELAHECASIMRTALAVWQESTPRRVHKSSAARLNMNKSEVISPQHSKNRELGIQFALSWLQ